MLVKKKCQKTKSEMWIQQMETEMEIITKRILMRNTKINWTPYLNDQ